MTATTSKPFLPADPRARAAAAQQRSVDVIVKSALAMVLAAPAFRRVEDVAEELWPAEVRAISDYVTKAASAPAMTSASGWADTLGQTANAADFLFNMAGASAGATLLAKCLSFRFGRNTGVRVPSVTTSAGTTGFVAEGAPIPVKQINVSSVVLSPKHFATLIPFSREVRELSSPNIETVARIVMNDAIAMDLDVALFGNVAADATRPAGLLVGLSPLGTPSTGTPSHTEALATDVSTLAAAVASVGLNEPIYFVASPRQASALRLFLEDNPTYTVLASSALPDKSVICVASNAICSALDPAVRFEIASDGAVVMDTAPGTPLSGVTRSLFQTDTVVLKMVFNMCWALRSPSGLAYMTAVNW
jgi:hypothetical protein